MRRPHSTTTLGLAAAVIAVIAFTAGCAGDDDTTQAESATTSSADTSSPAETGSATPIGPACAGIPAEGPGSLSAIATEPVASAAAQTEALSTLVTAVTEAGLVDTLNNSEAITVFAPTNDAFAKIPRNTLGEILADRAALTEILTYHVVPGKQTADALAGGSFTTLQGGSLTGTKTGEGYQVNDANVVCGNVQTSNATVHLIDTVLIPES